MGCVNPAIPRIRQFVSSQILQFVNPLIPHPALDYNLFMDGLIDPSPIPAERDTSTRTIVIAIAVIVAIAGAAALLLRERPQPKPGPPPYAASLKFSDLKMSQAQNFVGATVTYIDGTLNNTGDKTLAHAVVQVTFKDSYGQVAQIENVPIKVFQTGGPYDDTAD